MDSSIFSFVIVLVIAMAGGGLLTGLVLLSWNKAVESKLLLVAGGWAAAAILGVAASFGAYSILNSSSSQGLFIEGAIFGLVIGTVGGLVDLYVVRQVLRH